MIKTRISYLADAHITVVALVVAVIGTAIGSMKIYQNVKIATMAAIKINDKM